MYKKTRLLPVLSDCSLSAGLSLLVDNIVAISNHCNEYLRAHEFPSHVLREDEPKHPFWSVQRRGLAVSRQIGDLLRREDGVLDKARYSLIMDVYLDIIEERWQMKRRIMISTPSLAQIISAVYHRNTLITDTGVYMYFRECEGDDAYGNPAYHSKYKYVGALLPKDTYFLGEGYYIVKEIYRNCNGKEPDLEDWPNNYVWMLE